MRNVSLAPLHMKARRGGLADDMRLRKWSTGPHWLLASDHDVGTLYVLANRDNSLAKIGLTRSGKPDTRADDYSRAHGIQWHVYWFADTRNVAEAERRA